MEELAFERVYIHIYIYIYSAFVETLMEELAFERVPSGGAGNKMMMLLEGIHRDIEI